MRDIVQDGFDQAPSAMLITDDQARIVAVNQAFTRLSGYAASQLLGKTPFLMKSRRHDEEFYDTLWAELILTSKWSGEIWCRHSTGRIYAAQLTIAGMVGEHDKVSHYIAVASDITANKRDEERARQTLFTDPLTGLPDRTLFIDRLGRICSRYRRDKRPAAVMFLNVDHFSAINDNFGFDAGDELLREMALRLKNSTRESDTITRFDGDQFGLILPDLMDPGAGDVVAKKLTDRLSEIYQLGYHHRAYITVRSGLAVLPVDGFNGEDLVKSAQLALSRAKHTSGAADPFRLPIPASGTTGRSWR